MVSRKIRVYATLFLILSCLTAGSRESYSATIGVGLTGYYASWKPAFSGAYTDGMELQPDFLFGPVITLSFFEKWSLGFILLQNLATGFDGEWGNSGTGPSGQYLHTVEGPVLRGDIDVSLSYKLSSFFRLFGGFKYYDYGNGNVKAHYNYNGFDYYEEGEDEPWGTFEFNGSGIAAGFTLSHMFTEQFSVSMNNSFVYFFHTYFYTDVINPPTVSYNYYNTSTETEKSGTAYGFNTQLLFSYYFTDSEIALAAGGRFQYLKYSLEGIDMKNDIIFGPVVSAVKYF